MAGLSPDALIAPWVIEGAMDGPAFTAWVETQLVPELNPGAVVILDNLSTHKVRPAAHALRRAGCRLRRSENTVHRTLFRSLRDPSDLPAYSPDLNPIEMAFAKLHAHLRRIGARPFDDPLAALGDICATFRTAEQQNSPRHAGYVPT